MIAHIIFMGMTAKKLFTRKETAEMLSIEATFTLDMGEERMDIRVCQKVHQGPSALLLNEIQNVRSLTR